MVHLARTCAPVTLERDDALFPELKIAHNVQRHVWDMFGREY